MSRSHRMPARVGATPVRTQLLSIHGAILAFSIASLACSLYVIVKGAKS